MLREPTTISDFATELAEGRIVSFDFLTRSRIERAVFIEVAQFLLTKFSLTFNGFSDASWWSISRLADASRWPSEDVDVVRRAFAVRKLLATSDPYWIPPDADPEVVKRGRRILIADMLASLGRLIKKRSVGNVGNVGTLPRL